MTTTTTTNSPTLRDTKLCASAATPPRARAYFSQSFGHTKLVSFFLVFFLRGQSPAKEGGTQSARPSGVLIIF